MGCEGPSVFLTVDSTGEGSWNVTLGLDSTGYTGSKDGVVRPGSRRSSGASISRSCRSRTATGQAQVRRDQLDRAVLRLRRVDFVCTGRQRQTDDVYTWNFLVTGGSVLDTSSWAIKFQYCDQSDTGCRAILSARGRAARFRAVGGARVRRGDARRRSALHDAGARPIG
jgi:hypothetical protein